MISIDKKVSETLVIQKSKFICYLFPCHEIEEMKQKLEQIKEIEKDATHYCYAYILGNQKRFSDDGEPSGTAGMPILNVLESQGLDHILAIVVRYFGGIKLGAGGLVRAYTNAVSLGLQKVQKVSYMEGVYLSLEFPYNQEKNILKIIHPYPVEEKEYHEKITYRLFLPKEYLPNLENISYQILKEPVLGQEKKA